MLSNTPFHLDVPPFRPHPLVRGGHAQTVLGNWLGNREQLSGSRQHVVPVSKGDAVVLHDDQPADWSPGGRVAILLHGLAGFHGSGYMVRTASKLNGRGVRTFRMDLRAAGAGAPFASLPYHPGQSEDALAALRHVAKICPGSSLVAIGFSLGGNILLKMLGEFAVELPTALVFALAINPAVDLRACYASLARRQNRLYDRYFVRKLWRQIVARPRLRLPADIQKRQRPPRNLRELDDRYTRIVWGFSSFEEYLAQASAVSWLQAIRVPTLLVAADDDPIVPRQVFDALPTSPAVRLSLTRGGGHLGFFGRSGVDSDHRWLEWRIVDWTLALPASETLTKAA